MLVFRGRLDTCTVYMVSLTLFVEYLANTDSRFIDMMTSRDNRGSHLSVGQRHRAATVHSQSLAGDERRFLGIAGGEG